MIDYNTGEVEAVFEKEFEKNGISNMAKKLSNGNYVILNSGQNSHVVRYINAEDGTVKSCNLGFSDGSIYYYRILEIDDDNILVSGSHRNTAGVYNAKTNSFRRIALEVGDSAPIVLDKTHILFTGGLKKDDKRSRSILVYNLRTGVLKSISLKMQTARYEHKAMMLNDDEILLYGGMTTPPISEFDFSPIGLFNSVKAAAGPIPFAESISKEAIMRKVD